jgi:hypothetical protein
MSEQFESHAVLPAPSRALAVVPSAAFSHSRTAHFETGANHLRLREPAPDTTV